MSTQNEIAALLRQGIELARANNRAAAREKFERVVELDENNEKGWMWLASVVDSEDERRVCLANVLHINPSNEKARQALDKLNQRQKEQIAQEEVAPGITRRQLTFVLGGGVLIIVILIVGLLAITVSNSQASAAATANAIALVQTSTAEVIYATGTAFAATETQLAIATPTPTPTPTPDIPTLPPTWTPTPEPTMPPTRERLPPPTGLTGYLAAWSGRDILNNGFLPVGFFNFDAGGQFIRTGNELGRNPRLFPNGQRMVYTRYDQLLFSTVIEAVNLNGTQTETLNDRFLGQGVLDTQQPSYSADGTSVVFVGRPQDGQTLQVFLLSLLDRPPGPNAPSPLRRMTNDAATYSFPSISPDGRQIAVIRNDTDAANPGRDIVIIDIATGSQFPITSDRDTFIETHPRWSPDGSQIVYAVAPGSDPNNFDIFVINSRGTGSPSFLYRDPSSSSLHPVISRDGRYLAFSSNRTGSWDIFIYDLQTQMLTQLTDSPEDDYPSDWWQP